MSKYIYTAQVSAVTVRQVEIESNEPLTVGEIDELARKKFRKEIGDAGIIVSCEIQLYSVDVEV